jgi:hypothetical protein
MLIASIASQASLPVNQTRAGMLREGGRKAGTQPQDDTTPDSGVPGEKWENSTPLTTVTHSGKATPAGNGESHFPISGLRYKIMKAGGERDPGRPKTARAAASAVRYFSISTKED